MANYRAPTNIRFPPDLHKEIKELSEKRNVSFAQIVIEACYQYLDKSAPGLCPSCHTQNPVDAQYCQKCGQPLTKESSETLKQEIEYLREKLGEQQYKLEDLTKALLGLNEYTELKKNQEKKKMEEEKI